MVKSRQPQPGTVLDERTRTACNNPEVLLRIILSLAFLTACAAPDTLDTVASASKGAPDVDFYTIFPPDSVIESVLVKDRTCGIVFHGVSDPAADTLAFWTVGVDAIKRDIPYPTDARPNFYAIFTPSNPTLNHTVAGFEAYDHYHVADRDSRTSTDTLWDPFIVNPGPNFNAATYRVAKSVKEMNRQIAAGILAAPVTTIDAGFGPVVFHGEIACGRRLEEIYAGDEPCNTH